jgi:predicted dehydrogenase
MAHFRIGVVGGAGGQGGTWCSRLKLWRKALGHTLQLVAIADIQDLALAAKAKKLHVTPYKDYREMMDKESLDLVINATPHYLHAPVVLAAAERGINILSEKPTAINLPQVDAMIKAVDAAKIKCAIGFQHRFDPTYAGLKNAIDSGDLGEIFQINMQFHWWRDEKYYINSTPVPENQEEKWEGWRGHWHTEGAGALANQIIHFIDLFQWLSPSPIQAVMAASRVSKHTLVETDDNTNAIVEFQDGSMGNLQAGVAYEYGKQEEYGIYGTQGALVRRHGIRGFMGIPGIYEDFRKASVKARKRAFRYMPWTWHYDKVMFEHLIQAIVADDPSYISVDVHEGRKSVELMRAMLLSQQRGEKIVFPFEDPAEEFPQLPHTYRDPQYAEFLED